MEFRIEKVLNPNITKYKKSDLDTAYHFATEVSKEFGHFLKAVVIFGSAAREKEHSTRGDIDILLVVDDVSVKLSAEMVEAYRVISEKLVLKVSKRLHVTTLKFSSFWEYIRAGDPIAINILRDGIALVDAGFFEPLQKLLTDGRIRPTQESIWTYFSRAPATIQNSRWHMLQATLDLYWAVIDSSHAALMSLGEIPPSPGHVADMLEERMVKKKLLPYAYAKTMRKFYELSRGILHREIKEISGQEYEGYFREADEYVKGMRKFIERRGNP